MSLLDIPTFQFVDVSRSKKSEVWKYFLLNKDLEKAKCNLCSAELKISGCSTGSLVNHLKKHKIIIKRSISEPAACSYSG